MLSFIRSISFVSRLFGYLAAFMIFLAVIITCEMIFVRFVLGESTIWQTETVVFLCVGATILGMPYVQILKGHVNVDLLPSLLPPRYAKVLSLVSYILSLAIFAIMFWYGFGLFWEAWEKNWKTESLNEFSLWIPYLAMPIGFGLFFLQLLADLLHEWFIEKPHQHQMGEDQRLTGAD